MSMLAGIVIKKMVIATSYKQPYKKNPIKIHIDGIIRSYNPWTSTEIHSKIHFQTGFLSSKSWNPSKIWKTKSEKNNSTAKRPYFPPLHHLEDRHPFHRRLPLSASAWPAVRASWSPRCALGDESNAQGFSRWKIHAPSFSGWWLGHPSEKY